MGRPARKIPLPIPKDVEVPIVVKFPPQPFYYVKNVDTAPFHATRIEFKHGFPNWSVGAWVKSARRRR
jgi:hypothetical protein